MFRVRLLLPALCAVLFAPVLHAATFSVSGTTLAIDLTAANETVAITAGATNYTFALTGGTWSGTDGPEAMGNGTASLSAVKALVTAVTVDDSGTGNSATFNDSGANTYDASFTITLDSASSGGCTMVGTTAFTGSAALFVQAGAVAMISATISTVNGHLTLLGNMQIPGKTGNSNGVNINGSTVSVSGSGDLTIKGTSGISTATQMGVRLQGASIITGGTAGTTLTIEGFGAASTATNYGLNIKDAGTTVTTNGGNVVIVGVGGSGATSDNKGVLMEASTSILATGSGSVSVTGTGGGANSNQNTGVELLTGSQIASVNGNVSVTGTGGGAGTGGSNRGVLVSGSIKSTGSGNVAVTGTGGPGSAGDNQGVLMERNLTGTVQEIKSGTGNVTVTGTAGGGTGSLGIKVNSVAAAAATISTSAPGVVSLIADSMSLVTSAIISAPTVSIAPKTAGKNMDLGSTSDSITNTLALSQAELNTITASTLNLGDVNTAVINLSANLTRPAGTTTNLTAAVINFNTFTFTGGTINQILSGQAIMTVEQPAGTAIVSGVTKSFGNVAVGGTADLFFTVKNSGSGDLTGLTIMGLSGTDFSVFASPTSPVVPAGSTSFTIRFAPTGSEGLKTAALSLASNALGVPSFAINLTGFSPSTSPLSGTKSVGPTGFYASLTQAITDIQTAGLGGALVLELQPAYVSTVETFPVVFTNLGTTATNTLTIRPASGATALAIASAAATIDLNGAQFVTFDGRPGGVGTAKELTIENTSTTGVALRFINEASNNTLRHITLRGVNNSASSGTVVFSTTTGANGNDNNTLDTCDIRDGASTPRNGIYSLGTSTTTAQFNSGNTVTNCNVFNFDAAASVDAAGARLEDGNDSWTFTGNSFYQTATRPALGANVRAIFINNAGSPSVAPGNNFTVADNFFGGDSPGATVTTQKWTTNGVSFPYLFQGIRLRVGTTAASSVQGNTFANIVWGSNSSATALPGVWSGIYVTAGSVNIGTVTGNTIGSGTGTGSISVTTSGSGGTTFGIGSASSGTANIANNTIGSITVNGSGSTISASLTGISVTAAGTNTISGNTIGSTTTAHSLNAATSSTSSTPQQVTGISTSGGASITGNTVANLNNNYIGTATGGQIRGIITSAGVNTITGNTVRNLSTTSANTSTAVSATQGQSVLGIADTSSTAGQTVSQNTVHSLANTTASAAVSVTGIYYNGPTSGTNVIERNFVHSLAVSSSSISSVVNGMQFAAGTFTAQNNMVRVGFDASGTSTANRSAVRGIYDNGTTAGRNFYHNTVYVGGTQSTGSTFTFAFNGSTGVSNTRTYQNNLFVNARSNSGATSKHYAVTYGGTTVNPAGLAASNNLFFASGTGGVFGLFNSVDRSTLAAWQTATGVDASSLSTDPLFVLPTGDAITVDLHLSAASPAEQAGTFIASVTDDFDGQTRSALTPVDIGADAGDFGLGIALPPLTHSSTTHRVLTGWATITSIGNVSSGANAPRLYFKKASEADAFLGNTSADNGWKYVTTSSSTSPYSFTVDYSLLTGGGVVSGDSIEYFVVAQDEAGQFRSTPWGAVTTGNSVQAISAKPTNGVLSYAIVDTISGARTVGTGGDFPSLSGAGGLFAALNSRVLTGDVTVTLTSDLTEDGSVLLNEFITGPSYPSPPYSVTIAPDSATMRTISGSGASGLIRFNGADRVTIDGRFGGSGRFITLRNTSTAAATLSFANDASNNTVRNCVIEGAGGTSSIGVVFFGTGTVTGNDNNAILENHIRDRSDAAGVPASLIVNNGTSGINNSGNSVTGNSLFNFGSYGVNITANGSEAWIITGNTIYRTSAGTAANIGIQFVGVGNNLIADNTIRDLTTTGQAVGIYLGLQTGNTTVARNRLYNLGSAGTSSITGIFFVGTGAANAATFVNNMVSISQTGTDQNLRGLSNQGSGSVFNAYYNTIVISGTGSGSSDTWAFAVPSQSVATVKNNIFMNLRTGGGNHYAAGGSVTTGSIATDYNLFVGTGTIAANFFDSTGGGSTTGIPISYAQWQTNMNGDSHSNASNPGGDYSSAMFVNAAAGDLHLIPGGNVLVNNTGTTIPGFATDYDGDTRSFTTPSIGADEAFPFLGFQAWAATYGQSNDPLVLGPNGQANLINFAFGMAPTASGALVLNGTLAAGGIIGQTGTAIAAFEPSGNGVDFRALFVRRKDYVTAGLTYTPQFSADMTTWFNSATVPTVLADDGTHQIVSVPYPPFVGGGKKARFFRISVSL